MYKSSQKVQIVPVPCGTGNALAHSMGLSTPELSLNYFLKTKKQNLRQLKIHQVIVKDVKHQEKHVCFSFCILSWGLHAQIVRQSEHFRFLGSLRFLVAALWNVMSFPNYSCELSLNTRSSTSTANSNTITTTNSYAYFLATQMTFLEKGFHICPSATFSCYSLLTLIKTSRWNLLTFLFKASGGQHIALPNVSIQELKSFRLKPLTGGRHIMLDTKLKSIHDICVDGEVFQIENGQEMEVKEANNQFILV